MTTSADYPYRLDQSVKVEGRPARVCKFTRNGDTGWTLQIQYDNGDYEWVHESMVELP